MKKKRISILAVFITLIIVSKFAYLKDLSKVNYIEETVMAQPSDYSIEEFYKDNFGVKVDGCLVNYSSIANLFVITTNSWKTLTIRWDNLEKIISFDSEVFYIRWRPGYSSFLYYRYEEDDDGGDVGSCSIHYIDVQKENGELKVIERTIIPYIFDTDFAWSSDGKYFVYCDGSSLRIRNFETGMEWVTKQIQEIDKDNNNYYFYPGVYIIGLKWIDNDQKIFLRYKDTPGVDMSYSVEIDLKQFDLK